jgi:dGTPase
LGDTNGTIVYTLVADLVAKSLNKGWINFSSEVGDALKQLKLFNEEHIYRNTMVKKQTLKIKLMFELLFEKYLQDLETGNGDSDIHREYLDGMSVQYKERTPPPGIVRDFIAGMTDDYFLDQCHKNLIPHIKSGLF